MKRVLLMVFSIILVLACIFSITGIVPGLQDIMNINNYKNSDADTAKEGIAAARDGIAQLKENEQTYLEGVQTYISGQAQLAAGRAELAAGQRQIDENTEAYLAGKEQIATLESFMPYIQAISDGMQSARGAVAGVIGEDGDHRLGQLRSSVLNFLANTSAVSAISNLVGMDVGSLLRANPEDTSICGSVVAMYYDGLAQLKQYEDGLAQLAAGRAQLAAGEQQLKEGDEQLMVYEDGEKALIAGMIQLMESMVPTYHQKSFEQSIASLPEYMANTAEMKTAVPTDILTSEGFNEDAYMAFVETMTDKLYAVDENGERVVVRDNDHVNLDNCLVLCDCAEQYLADQEADIKSEVFPRIGIYGAEAIAALLGLVAGIMGIIAAITGGKKTGKGFGIVSAVLAVAAVVAGFVTGFQNYIYPIRLGADGAYAVSLEDMASYAYTGDKQVPVIIALAVAAVLFVIFASIAKKAAKKKTAQKAAAAPAPAASEDAERVARLEAENTELKAMVAEMAASAATSK